MPCTHPYPPTQPSDSAHYDEQPLPSQHYFLNRRTNCILQPGQTSSKMDTCTCAREIHLVHIKAQNGKSFHACVDVTCAKSAECFFSACNSQNRSTLDGSWRCSHRPRTVCTHKRPIAHLTKIQQPILQGTLQKLAASLSC